MSKINEENEILWNILLNMPKWRKKPLSAIELAEKKLSQFEAGFQRELIERAIAGNYQGIIFPNTKKEYEQYLKENGTTKIERLQRLINNG